MKRFAFLMLALLLVGVMYAQNAVRGVVTAAEDGSPIPYATVLVKGTNTNVQTNDDGEYTINAPQSATLEFMFLGYATQSIPVNGKSVVNASLSVDAIALDETIVVAYGTVKKGSYSGSASVIGEDAIKDAPVVSFEQVLAGKAPGVQVASNSGQPGSEVEISIRGFGSFNAGNSPLYVIDGVPATSGDYSSGNISTSAMNYLNPSDIASITILKDAAAASLYGSRASNGVVLITTKKGQSGKLVSTFKASAGVSYFAYDNYPLATDEQTEALHREAWTNYANKNTSEWSSSYGSIDAYVNAKVEANYPSKDESTYIYKDWEDVLFRTGITQNYEYSISGGGDKSKIYASIGYTDQQGVVTIDYLERFSSTINAEAQISNRIKIGGSMQYSWQYQTGHQDGWSSKDNPFFIWKVVLTERWPYAYSDGSLYLESMNPSLSTINPVASYDAQINDATQNRLILKGFIDIDLADGLKLKSVLSNDLLQVHDRFAWLYGHPNFYAYSDIGGYISDRYRDVNRMVSSTTLNYDKTFGEHHITALAGWEAEEEKYVQTRVGKIDLSYLGATESVFGTGYDEASTYSREESLLSMLSSVSYDYGARYYLTGTFRRDGSSRLAPETRWGNFWSLSASWRFSNESFLDFEWLNEGKLRSSYGTSGTLPSDYFGYMSVYDYDVYGSSGASYPSNLANSDLSWEKNRNWNIGLDATIFDKYSVTAEYYNKKTTDLLLDATVPSTTGFSSSLMNIGSMSNRGWEFAVNVNIISKRDMDLSVGANWSTVDNEVLSLSEPGETIVSTPYVWKEGYAFYQFYTRNYLGVDPTDGSQLYAEGSFYEKGEIVDQEVIMKDGTVVSEGSAMPEDGYNYAPTTRANASSMIIEGKTALPKGFGGFDASFRWKDLSVSMAWSYKYGHYIWDEGTEQLANDGYYSFGRNIWASQVDTWSEDNTDATIPQRVAGNTGGGYYYSSRYLKKGDYLRLKNLTVSYNLPKTIIDKFKLVNARVYLSGSNLLTFSGLDIDPEIGNDGYYNYNMPALRTVNLGVEVSF